MERLCKNCKHYRWEPGPMKLNPEAPTCRALEGKIDPVHGGDIDSIIVWTMRMTLCGFSDPKYWEPKP